jgi:hypothetical protein
MRVNGRPNFSRGFEANDMSKNIWGKSVHEPAENLLITSNPGGVGGV